jgi:hypothetical protein
MFKAIFLQLGGEQGAFDIFMDIGEYFQEFQEQLSELASAVFGVFGF